MTERSENREVMGLFRALAAGTRIEIVRLLSSRSLCVSALSNLLGVSAGAVSQHLRVLRDAGLVEADRRGYFLHYRVAPAARNRFAAAMEQLFDSKKGARSCAARKRSAKGQRS